ncbi:60Kd inner membrane protein-domain-containing protein [Leucosporidium creatinivorum]|uniref:60Kd inner membrane protein-domain-containing protein n=1 Tax=Leucosporidium creatinivorum TaxID=106004 RepID=A0A1Y2EY11_9BASI|nr:60Kd inner membrane protein-domain-containing protein [Leucosporidium creatinivorum]
MAALHPAKGLRHLLASSSRPSAIPSLLLRTSLRPSPSPSPSSALAFLASQRHRGFASTSLTSGWFSSDKPAVSKVAEEATPTSWAAAAAEEPAALPSTSAGLPSATSTTTAPSSTAPLGAPAPPEALAEALSTAPPSPTEPTFTLPSTDIFTGTLDLTALSGSWGPHPIMRLQSMFLKLHESFPFVETGLAWYLLIPAITLALRFVLFGFQVRAQANAARMAIIQPQMLKGMEKLKAAKARGDFTGAQAAQMETQALMQKHNVNPIRNLAFPLAQATVFMTMFFAIKGLAGAGIPSLATEGLGWVQDLTKPDPYWALPVASTALTLATLELGVDSTTQVQTSTTKNMKMFFRIMLVMALPFIAYFPAALLIYWVTNNSVSLLQSLLLKQPLVRSFFSIPVIPPKPQPGEVGYVPEPSFSDAFKNMQLGMQEKWEETQQKAEEERARKEAWEGKSGKKAEVYTPRSAVTEAARRRRVGIDEPRAPRRKVGEVEKVVNELAGEGLLEKQSSVGPITAEPRVQGGGKESVRARRIQAAREKRLAGKRE